MLRQKILDYIYDLFLKKVPIEQIYTEKTTASLRDGWGNKQISHLPIYKFFKLYLEGYKKEAYDSMTEYYLDIAINKKAIYIKKEDGGMKNGSTFQLVDKLHKELGITLNKDLTNLDINITKKAIQQRVQYRFNMIDSIKKHGYSPSCQLIHASYSKDTNKYFLTDGHHRVATMDILGYKSIPLAINKPVIIKRIRRILRILHPKC